MLPAVRGLSKHSYHHTDRVKEMVKYTDPGDVSHDPDVCIGGSTIQDFAQSHPDLWKVRATSKTSWRVSRVGLPHHTIPIVWH